MLQVHPEIFERFPGVRIGIVVAEGVDNTGDTTAMEPDLRRAEESLRQAFADTPVIEHPNIACWREAYREFGAKPKKYPSSIEAMTRRVLKGDSIPSISSLVDLYNTVSLSHILPVGGEDLDRIEGPLTLRFAGEDEPEVSLLGRPEPQAPTPGEVIYADDVGAVCRRWNWREAARTCITTETRNAILVIEAVSHIQSVALVTALEELADSIQRHCGGELTTRVIDGAE